jgi:hypothetical protein
VSVASRWVVRLGWQIAGRCGKEKCREGMLPVSGGMEGSRVSEKGWSSTGRVGAKGWAVSDE